jgi:hypothetical protein
VSARLIDGRGNPVAVTVAYDAAARTVTLRPSAPLAAGTYVATLAGARDADGRALAKPHDVRFTVGPAPVDGRPPETRISSGPGPIHGYDFLIDSDEPGVTIECAYRHRPFAPCDFDDSRFEVGGRSVRVRARDAAGNADPTPAVRSWRSGDPPESNEYPRYVADLLGASGSTTAGLRGVLWYRWTAETSGPVRFDTRGSEPDTVLTVMVHEGDDGDGLALEEDEFEVVGTDDDSFPSRAAAVEVDAAAGTAYWIRVNGFSDHFTSQGGRIRLNWNETAAEPPHGLTGGVTELDATTATLHGTLDRNGTWRFEWGPVDGPLSTTPARTGEGPVEATLTGLAPDTAYRYRLLATTAAGDIVGDEATFRTLEAIGADTAPADEIGSSTATVRATNVRGSSIDCSFEWGTTTAYGTVRESVVSCYPGRNPYAWLRGLRGGTTYHYRVLVHDDETGRTVYGADMTFTTAAPSAPSVSHVSAPTATTESTLELGVGVNANGSETTCWIEWGTTPAYGGRTPEREAVGLGETSCRDELTGLAPATTYHVRAVARNAQGTTYGPDRTVKTAPAAPVVVTGAPDVGSRTATLRGTLTPGASPGYTVWWFEVYEEGEWISVDRGSEVENGGPAREVTAESRGTPTSNETFRLVARSDGGTRESAPVTFTYAAGTPEVSMPEAMPRSDTVARAKATVTPNGLDGEYWVEYGTTTAYGSRTESVPYTAGAPRPIVATLTGLTPSTTYHWRAVVRNELGTAFSESKTVRTASSSAPYVSPRLWSWGNTSADVIAEVEPRGFVTTYRVEYGETTAYGASTPERRTGPIFGAVETWEQLEALRPNTVYHWRMVATNAVGTSVSPDRTFTTLRAVPLTGEATGVEGGRATIHGTVDPQGAPTTWYFRYGPTTRYGKVTPVRSLPATAGPTAVAEELEELLPGATIHYQLVADDGPVTYGGRDRAFVVDEGAIPSPTPTPTPTPTPSPTPTPTATPSPHTTPDVTPSPTPTSPHTTDASSPGADATAEAPPGGLVVQRSSPVEPVVALDGARRRGLGTVIATVRSDRACTVRLRLVTRRRTLARGVLRLAGAGTEQVALRASRAGRRWLRRHPRARLAVTATSPQGTVRMLLPPRRRSE